MTTDWSMYGNPPEKATNWPDWYDPEAPSSRFWISDPAGEPEWSLPFGEQTTRIADEEGGGILLYVHVDNAQMVLDALRLFFPDPPQNSPGG